MNTNPLPLQLVYTEETFAVAEKPPGLLAVPGRGPDKQDCLTARFRARFPEAPPYPAVHRLDMATSGLMLLARTKAAHRTLSTALAARRFSKEYTAVVEGRPPGREGTIDLAFRLDPENRPHQIYDPERGKRGITQWKILPSSAEPAGDTPPRTRILFRPLTGRTHQLRTHAAHPLGLGCPIAGDPLYGRPRSGDSRLLLHASRLRFPHPETGRPVEITSPPPF